MWRLLFLTLKDKIMFFKNQNSQMVNKITTEQIAVRATQNELLTQALFQEQDLNQLSKLFVRNSWLNTLQHETRLS